VVESSERLAETAQYLRGGRPSCVNLRPSGFRYGAGSGAGSGAFHDTTGLCTRLARWGKGSSLTLNLEQTMTSAEKKVDLSVN
jgi:hypothetical protein